MPEKKATKHNYQLASTQRFLPMPHSSPLSVWFHFSSKPTLLPCTADIPDASQQPSLRCSTTRGSSDIRTVLLPERVADTHPQLALRIAVAPLALGASGDAQNPGRSPLAHPGAPTRCHRWSTQIYLTLRFGKHAAGIAPVVFRRLSLSQCGLCAVYELREPCRIPSSFLKLRRVFG